MQRSLQWTSTETTMFNPLDPDSWLDLLVYWRFFLPLAVGVAAGIGLYRVLGSTPDAAAIAAVAMVMGLVVGGAWELLHGSRNRPLDP
jgi:hypothetical protein